MYVLAVNDTIVKFPYSITELKKDNPQVSFPRNPSQELLATYNVYPIKPSPRPAGDVIISTDPEFANGEWVQTWVARQYTSEEVAQQISDRRNAMVVTPRQARLALVNVDMLDNVDFAIAAIPDPIERKKAEIEWEYATTIERNSSWVVAMTESLEMTPEQVDSLFELAATL
jgi:hypothetical protein